LEIEHMFILPLLQAATGFTKDYAAAWAMLGAGIGAGLAVIGAGIGIGRIGGSATEAIAGTIQTGGLILAALIEGAALFAIVVALLISLKFTYPS
jgi:F-type H+-transporting ATPase subunit c